MVICSCDPKDFTSFGSRGVLNIHVNSGNWHTFSHCYTEPTDINLIIFTFVFETSGYQLVLARTTKTKVLYLKLNKALCSCVKSTMLWYNLFTETLTKMGLELNPYSPCVANKTINRKQCTIIWYVDNLKISHMEETVIRDLLHTIEKEFSGNLTITIRKGHDYLSMNITLPGNGTIQIKMKHYIKEAFDAFGEGVSRGATTPAKHNLFTIDTKMPTLPKEKADLYHHIVTKLLYIPKRSWLDIQLPHCFLNHTCRRMHATGQGQVRQSTKVSTPNNRQCLDPQSMDMFMGASFAVHTDFRSHTSGMITME